MSPSILASFPNIPIQKREAITPPTQLNPYWVSGTLLKLEMVDFLLELEK